ncbi:MAG: hypothetical protein HY766_16505 [candidate division NC10 bacterium]|nr:hypothetical protein [candidate division NC10 bacterium]
MMGYSGDHGLAVNARLNSPTGVAIGPEGQLYIADTGNNRIRVVEANGLIRTFAGTGRNVTLQDGVTATLADLNLGAGCGVAVTTLGEVLIPDKSNYVVRRVDTQGMISTVAGRADRRQADELAAGPALRRFIGAPTRLAVGPNGEIAVGLSQDSPLGPTRDPAHYVRALKASDNGRVAYSAVGSFGEFRRNADGTYTRIDPELSEHTYAATGLKTAWTDKSGNVTEYRYTADGLMEAIVEPTGATWTLEYAGGKLARVRDPAGRTTLFEVDANGNLASITDPDGATVRYGYDSSHRMTRRTSALGYRFGATYSARGQVVKGDEPDAGVRRFVPQDSIGLVNDLPEGLGTLCQPAPAVRPETVFATFIDAQGGVWKYYLGGSRQITKEIDPLGRTTEYVLNQAGQVVIKIRPNGSRILYTYGSLGQLQREEDTGIPVGSRGAIKDYYYSAASTVIPTSVVDRLGRTTRLELDASARPVRLVDGEGLSEQVTYESRGLVATRTDQTGQTTSYTYNSSGNPTRITFPGGDFKEMTYTPEGYVASITDEEGRTTRMTYTAHGLIETQTNAKGGVRRFEYDADRRLVATTDEREKRRLMAYDAHDRLVRTQSPSGRVETRAYDFEGQLTGLTDAKNRTTAQVFDAARQMIRRKQPGDVVTTYEYGSAPGGGCTPCSRNGGLLGLLTRVVDPNGHATSYSHDATGRTTRVVDSVGGKAKFTLDPEGNVLQREDPDGLTTFMTYDNANRLVIVTDPRVGTTTRVLDGVGHVIRERNAVGQVTERQYDQRGRLTKITVAVDTVDAASTSFEYDRVGNLTALVTPRGFRWVFADDSLNRLIRETDPDNRSATFDYDPTGNLTYMRDRKAQETRWEYNDEGEKTAIIYHDGSRVDLTYDETGQLTSAADGRVTVQRTYDELDRLKTLTIPQLARVLEMEYDKASNRTTFSINGQRSTYQFDALNRLVKLAHSSGAEATWGYNPIGLVTAKTIPNGISVALTYEQRRLKKMEYKTAAMMPLSTFEYTFDGIANIQSMRDDEGQHWYTYDNQNRLKSAMYPDMTSEVFGYDKSSNRVLRLVGQNREVTDYDAADQIVQTRVMLPPSPCPPGTPPELCPGESVAETRDYEHDANGNLTVIRTTNQLSHPATVVTTSFGYDVRDKLTRVTLNDGRFVENEYYPDSPLRMSFTEPGGAITKVVWDPLAQDLAQDLDMAGAVMAEYIQGTRIDDTVGVVLGGTAYAYVGDHLNSIWSVVDGSGAVQNRYRYEAFGSSRYAQEGVPNRLRFTAREWDPAVGTQHNRWRHYLPQIGRWTQKDPVGIPGESNQYQYAASSPLVYVDPSGLTCECTGLHRLTHMDYEVLKQFHVEDTVVDHEPNSPLCEGNPKGPDAKILLVNYSAIKEIHSMWEGDWTGEEAYPYWKLCGAMVWQVVKCRGHCYSFKVEYRKVKDQFQRVLLSCGWESGAPK